eukprot:9592507-Lingulodinium_polyedra.AAC.1
MPCVLVPPEQLGQVLRSGQSYYSHDDYADLFPSGLTVAESLGLIDAAPDQIRRILRASNEAQR